MEKKPFSEEIKFKYIKMKNHRIIAINTGVLFLIAAVASILGLILYQPILEDSEYIVHSATHNTQIYWGAFFEIITAFAVIGTPISFFPILRKVNLSMAVATVSFRLLEAVIIILGILSLLAIISLNQSFSEDVNPNITTYVVSGKLLIAIKNWTFLFGPNLALGPSTLLTSYMLYKSKLIPKTIAFLGLIGGPLIFLSAIFVMFGFYKQISLMGTLTALPVFFYEMSLAICLVYKGFDVSKVEALEIK
jgi:hypothetical protein